MVLESWNGSRRVQEVGSAIPGNSQLGVAGEVLEAWYFTRHGRRMVLEAWYFTRAV